MPTEQEMNPPPPQPPGAAGDSGESGDAARARPGVSQRLRLSGLPRLPAWTRPRLSCEVLALLLSLYFVATANAMLIGRVRIEGGFTLVAAFGVLVLGMHLLLLLLVAGRWTLKPLAVVLLLLTAAAGYFMKHLGIYLDPSMLRNVLHTDAHEASELLNPALLGQVLLWGVLPAMLLLRVQLVACSWRRALLRRLLWLGVTVAVFVAVLLLAFQPIASMMRNHKDIRYLVTPANLLWSVAKVVQEDLRAPKGARVAIGLDAQAGPSTLRPGKPLLVVLVVGETVRAANWGLNGYTRQTTPRLAELPVLNFRQVTACGTNTEVSLPCLFAPVGRRDYDEDRIRRSESLLHLLARAGVAVHWRDNQSGCKGVCEGLPNDTVLAQAPPALCSQGRCLDEALLFDLDTRLKSLAPANFWVMHPLGNHGPAYHRRFPERHAVYTPYCRSDDLQQCSPPEIVNAYDNATHYTDEWLATLVQTLRNQADRIDSAVVFVSDHGESLGEHQLFLHGMPYPIAPDVQKRVPMVWWMSDGLLQRRGLDAGCLQQRRDEALAHDHVFHSLLNLVDVRTRLYDPAWDLLRPCQKAEARP